MIKGIIFDFDGLIFDTETHQYHILRDMFTEQNLDLPIQFWQQEIGTQSGFSVFKYLEDLLGGKIKHDVLKEQFTKKYHAILASENARDGVEEYLKAARDMNLKIGLATSSTYNWVSGYLKQLGIIDYFECIRTSDNVEKVKPDPALYLQVADYLDLAPEECLVFEDSANGALAAKRAGMNCVIVPNEVTNTMDFCDVEYRMKSMADESLKDVIFKVQKLVASRGIDVGINR